MADKRVILKDFTGGINRATDPCKMKENEFYDFQNLIIYSLGKIGNAVKRFGIENWHSVAVTGSKAMQIFQYITNSKSTNIDKIIVKTDSALRSLDTLTPANAYSEIVASGDVSGKVKFLTYRDNLYIFNRNSSGTYSENKFYDGTNYLAQGTPPCLQTFSLTQTGKKTGELDAGVYKYFITYVYDKLYESFGLFPNPLGNTWYQTNNADPMIAIPSAPISTTGKTIEIGSIPLGNARVTSRKIYRTKHDQDTFYFLAEIPDNTTNYFVDGNPDSKLGDPLDLSFVYAPPIAKYAIEHKGYMFMGNLKENTYKAPTIVTSGWSSAASGGLSKSGDTRLAKYSYKFAELNIIPSLESTGTSGEPYQGYWGDYTSAKRFELSNASHGNVNLVIPTANAYTGRIAIFRNTCLFPTTTTAYNTGQVTFTLATDPALSGLKAGDTVIIDGFTSFSGAGGNDPNGTFTVSGLGAGNTFSINFDTEDYNTYTTEGRVMPENYFLEGFPSLNGTAYVSTIADTNLYANANILSLKGLEQVSDKTLPSTIVWGYGDQFTDSIEVAPNDNDVITGFASEEDGLLIFKERKIYKLYTSNDSTLWQLREVANVGCTEPYSTCTIKSGVHTFISNGQIWVYSNGQTKKISDKIQPIIDGLGTITNTDVCYHPEKNWLVYTLGYTFGTITANEIFVLDLNFPSENNIGVWYYFATTYGTYNALSVRSPLSTKQGKLLFGSDLVNVLQYNKTGIYTDYINASGSAGTQTVSAYLRKYFDFDEWKITRLLMKFTIGTIDTLYYGINTTSSLVSLSNPSTGRVNVKIPSQVDVKRAYIFWFSVGDKALEIQEVGFDYIPKHEARGSY